jgi:hypothetical protein
VCAAIPAKPNIGVSSHNLEKRKNKMQFAKRMFMGFGVVAFMTVLLSLSAPKVVHGIVATLVQVANTSANPVPTLEEEAQSAFVAQGSCNYSLGSCNINTLYSVPAGRTAVLESLSVGCETSPSSVQASAGVLSFSPPGGGANVSIGIAPGYPFLLANGSLQTEALNLKTYAAGGPSGSNISFYESYTSENTTTAGAICSLVLSGHLE